MLQQLTPNGTTEKATPARRTAFWPAVPMRLADLRIPKSVVMDLILRHLHMDGISSLEVTSRTLKLGPVHDAVALRERLVRLRGVRDAVVVPEQGIAVLTVFAGAWDEQAALKTIGGEA